LTPVQRQTVQEVLSSSIVLYGNAVDRYVWDIRQGSTGSTIPGLGVASLPNGGLGPQILFPSISLHSYWFTRDASPELLADLLVEETFQRLQAQTTVAHLHTQQYGPFLNMPFEVFAQQFAQGYLRPFLEISQQSLLYEQSWSLQNQYRFFSPDGDIAPELDTSSPEYIDVAKTKLVELIRYSLHAQPSSLSDSAILRLVVSDPNFLRTVNDGFKESQYAARLRAAGVSEDNITIFHYFGMARPQGISILSGLPFDLTQ
ncbi:hypothetical protein KBC79_04390, partial [Candidatus Woesebacteria bacterium]|nr:hypothetical protein [Candidatus Woesebacteria bacterium]